MRPRSGLKPSIYSAFVRWIAENPLAGDVIPGSGGGRNVRWGREGKGQRGGTRVIDFNSEDGRIGLLIT